METTAFWKDKPELSILKPIWESCNLNLEKDNKLSRLIGKEVTLQYIFDKYVNPSFRDIFNHIMGRVCIDYTPYTINSRLVDVNDLWVTFEVNGALFKVHHMNYGQSWRIIAAA